MFRERPLTWLFILATVVVDLALNFGGQRWVFHGILFGQVAAIAIWAAVGHWHRLARGSLLVVAVGFLAYFPGPKPFEYYSKTLTFAAAHALLVVATSLVIVWLQNQVGNRFEGDRNRTPFRVPLIEFFGWTIVVAIASFGARLMYFGDLEVVLRSPSRYMLIYAVAPLALILFYSRFRPVYLVKAILFVGCTYLAASFLLSDERFVIDVTISAAYLTAWLLVRSIEYDQLKTSAENEDSTELDSDE
jgi:hypothetical protein